ncbi:MAG: SpoIIE family protein phosphatase [Planctomycetota bacterium]
MSDSSYLRLHRVAEESSSENQDLNATPEVIADQQMVADYWSRFSEATRWRPTPKSLTVGEIGSLELVSVANEGICELEELDTSVDGLTRSEAQSLAMAAMDLTQRLDSARREQKQLNTELAARATLIASPDQTQSIADQIDTTLSDLVAATDSGAVIVQMLDDATTTLTPRFFFGTSPDAVADRERALADCRGDLEAMVRDIVLIDDLSAGPVDTWNPPLQASSAICATLFKGDVPIGTMWLLDFEGRHWEPRDAAAVRLAGRSLSQTLIQAAAGEHAKAHDVTQLASSDALRGIGQWQLNTLPVGSRLTDELSADGMLMSPNSYASGWHTWDVLPDGMIAMAAAEMSDTGIDRVLDATAARAAFAAHSQYRHDPATMMRRLSDTIWQMTGAGGEMSMIYAILDPETGQGELASAGDFAALIGSSKGYRPLLIRNRTPLYRSVEPTIHQSKFKLHNSESLLAYTPGLLDLGADQTSLGAWIRDELEQHRSSVLGRIRRELASAPVRGEVGAIALTRLQRR